MNYKETISNFKAYFSGYHLASHTLQGGLYIILVITFIYSKAMFIGIYKWILKKPTPKNNYESESNYYKAWFCYIVSVEILKR